MINYELLFLKSLLVSIVIETTVLWLLCKFLLKSKNINLSTIIITGVLATMLTLPYLWFIFPKFIETKIYYHIVSELSAVFVESFVFLVVLKTNYKQSLGLSFACNAVSYISGLIFTIF